MTEPTASPQPPRRSPLLSALVIASAAVAAGGLVWGVTVWTKTRDVQLLLWGVFAVACAIGAFVRARSGTRAWLLAVAAIAGAANVYLTARDDLSPQLDVKNTGKETVTLRVADSEVTLTTGQSWACRHHLGDEASIFRGKSATGAPTNLVLDKWATRVRLDVNADDPDHVVLDYQPAK